MYKRQIIRQESRFNPKAESIRGASGLMQIMPATASSIDNRYDYRLKQNQIRLFDAKTNLEIGESYIEDLMTHPAINGDLFSLIMAYNAGPGTLSRWKRERNHIQDPLLFIETIPYAETRAFVERVMANYWIYRIKNKQPTPSLDAITEGRPAQYASR